jgi:Domain of unknown function (DUF305)
MMISHHQGAIDVAKAEWAYGQDPVMRRLAEKIIVDQEFRDSGHAALAEQEADREPNAPLNRLTPLYMVASLPERIGPEVLSYEAALVEGARTPIVVQAPARTYEFPGCGWATIVSIRSCASCLAS